MNKYCIVGIWKKGEIAEAKIMSAEEAVLYVTEKRHEKGVESAFSYSLNEFKLAEFAWRGMI